VDGDGIGDVCEPRLTVIVSIVNENLGTLDAGDFAVSLTRSLDGGVDTTQFRGDEAGTTFELDPNTPFSVAQDLIYSDFYATSLSTDCSGQLARGESRTCTIVNDDRDVTQTSGSLQNLTVQVASSPDGSVRDLLVGEFVFADASSGDSSLILLVSDYAVDFEYKKQGAFEPSDSDADVFNVSGTATSYSCVYDVVAIDGVPGAPAGWLSGDPLLVDETLTMGYTCSLDPSLPPNGTLKVTSSVVLYTRPGFEYTRSATTSVSGR
jgi:hypothetical protein